jgi:hypothetical protein
MLNRLGIEEDEIDDLVFEETDIPKEGIKWMALAKVHTTNYFSPQSFEQHMRVAWSPAKEVKFTALEENLFTIQCFCLGDWLKVDKGGPWLFRQNAVIIVPYDGLTPTESVDLNSFDAWIQIHKLPIGYRDHVLIKNLVEKKVGKVQTVETVIPGVNNFVRVQVKIDVRKVLARFVTVVRGGQREFFQLKYEKFPRFCGACGFLGHSHLECGSGEHDEAELKWGDWLKADWSTWRGRGTQISRGGGRFGRGEPAGMGRGTEFGGRSMPQASWRFNANILAGQKVQTEEEEHDTGSSPIKKTQMELDDHDSSNDSGAKIRLRIEYDTESQKEETNDNPLAMATDNDPPNITTNSLEKENDRSKCTKKAGADSPSLRSLDSREESDRAQC